MLKDILFAAFYNLPYCLLALLVVPIAILFVECILALLPDRKNTQNDLENSRPKVAILMPAHNEKQVIRQTLNLLAI